MGQNRRSGGNYPLLVLGNPRLIASSCGLVDLFRAEGTQMLFGGDDLADCACGQSVLLSQIIYRFAILMAHEYLTVSLSVSMDHRCPRRRSVGGFRQSSEYCHSEPNMEMHCPLGQRLSALDS